jgi:hypothetical protein
MNAASSTGVLAKVAINIASNWGIITKSFGVLSIASYAGWHYMKKLEGYFFNPWDAKRRLRTW